MLRLLFACIVGLVPTAAAFAADFVPKDLYLISRAIPDSAGAAYEGILRIDPQSAVVSIAYESLDFVSPILSYDSFRDMLVFQEVNDVHGLDADGVKTFLATGPFSLISSRGDGFLYTFSSSNGDFGYLDATNVFHDLLDLAGTATFNLGGASFSEMIYDPPTQSLICFGIGGVNTPCGVPIGTCITKIPLMPSGTQVAAAITTASLEVAVSSERVVGSAHVPSGQIMYVVDTNGNEHEGRMQLVDPETLALSTWARGGGYTFSAAISTGTYSHYLDAAILEDSLFNVFRYYAQDDSLEGTILVTSGEGISTSPGHSEQARMVEIPLAPVAAPPAGNTGVFFHPPHPNPFNPSTLLRFDVGRAQLVSLEIVDVRGRRVRRLLHEEWASGSVEVLWDGKDDRGVTVPSGVYFARLETDVGVLSRRVALIK